MKYKISICIQSISKICATFNRKEAEVPNIKWVLYLKRRNMFFISCRKAMSNNTCLFMMIFRLLHFVV